MNHYFEAIRYSELVKPVDPVTKEKEEQKSENDESNEDIDPTFTAEELDNMKSSLYANAAMAHMQLKNWGHTRDNSERVSLSIEFSFANKKN